MIFTLLAIENPAAQVERERHCNCTIVSAEKSFCFSSIFFFFKIFREKILDLKHFDSFFLTW